MSTWTVHFTLPSDPVMDRAIHAADQICYARQNEWTRWGLFIDRYKLRCMIADAIAVEIRKQPPAEGGKEGR